MIDDDKEKPQDKISSEIIYPDLSNKDGEINDIKKESVLEKNIRKSKDNESLEEEKLEYPNNTNINDEVKEKERKHYNYNEPPVNTPPINSSFSHNGGEKKDLVYIVYILYILGYVTGIANLIGVVLAYMVKDPEQPITYSHYQEQIKIFWFSLIGFIVGLLTVHIFLGVLILIFTYVWVIIKTVKGLLLLNKDKPFPKGEFL